MTLSLIPCFSIKAKACTIARNSPMLFVPCTGPKWKTWAPVCKSIHWYSIGPGLPEQAASTAQAPGVPPKAPLNPPERGEAPVCCGWGLGLKSDWVLAWGFCEVFIWEPAIGGVLCESIAIIVSLIFLMTSSMWLNTSSLVKRITV